MTLQFCDDKVDSFFKKQAFNEKKEKQEKFEKDSSLIIKKTKKLSIGISLDGISEEKYSKSGITTEFKGISGKNENL